MNDISHIANYLIISNRKSYSELTHLKLQKLLYYSQGLSYALNNKPLFTEEFIAWEHGPAVEEIYNIFRHFSGRVLVETSSANLNPEAISLINEVNGTYSQFSPWTLRCMTHEETPWCSTPKNEIISKDKIRNFFCSL